MSADRQLIEAGQYDRVIIRRVTWDGCVNEQEFGADRADYLITPRIDLALRFDVRRRYLYSGMMLENRRAPYGGNDMTCLVAIYQEDVSNHDHT